jgi:hypothetical protein
MREKILEYHKEGGQWPLAANILDPIRCRMHFPLHLSIPALTDPPHLGFCRTPP